MTRINDFNMTGQDILVAMCDGNPGALRAMMECMKCEREVDPDSALAPYGTIFGLDSMGCYGPAIWILFKDICGQDPVKMIAVLRAIQLGIASEREVKTAISAIEQHREPNGVDPAELLVAVQKQLPAFARGEPNG